MSQDWTAQPYPYPYPVQPGFDPADPLVSNDFNGWWRRSFALLKATWRPMAAIQAIIAVPTLALMLPAMLSFQKHQRVAQDNLQASINDGTNPNFADFFAGLPVLMAAAAVAGIFYGLGALACLHVAVSGATGRPGNPVGPALLAAAKRLLPLIGWYLLAAPVLIVAAVLCFFPVIYVGAVLTVLPVVVLLERGNGIGRCFKLFHANLGVSVSRIATIFGLSLAAGLVLTMVTMLVDVLVGGSLEAPTDTATVINTILQSAYYIPAYVVLPPLLLTAYADMRARLEPFTTASLRPDAA